MSTKNVLIIGAGPAGLTAATELLKEKDKYNVIILEESEFIGGISRTERYKNLKMDLGGHRYFTKNTRVNDMWRSLMPFATDKDVVENEEAFMKRNRISRIYFDNTFFDYPVTAKVFFQMNFISLISSGFSYICSRFSKLPEDNLENFYINRFGKKLYSMFFEGYTEKLWGRHPSEISADWGSQRVKGVSITEVLKNIFFKKSKEASMIEKFDYPKYGVGQMWEICANKIVENGGKIILNAKVTSVKKKNDSFTVGYLDTASNNNVLLTADIVISSMPIKDLIESFGVHIPVEVMRLANGLPYRDFMTCGVLIDKMKLKNKNGSRIKDTWIYVQDKGVKMGRIQFFNNWSPYLVDKENKDKTWIGCEYFCLENDNMWNMKDENFAKLVKEELCKIGIVENESAIIDTHVVRVKKAYPAYFDTYKDFGKIKEYLDSIEGLYCIGRNGQHRYNNMDHSMLTAMEAADNIKNGVTDNSNVWNVNTEKEYHETK